MTTATATKTRIACPLCKRTATVTHPGDKARGFKWVVLPHDTGFYACNNAPHVHEHMDVLESEIE